MKLPSRDTRAKLIRLLAVVSFVYLAAVALLVLGEPHMVYRPLPGPSDPAQIEGLGNYHIKTAPIEGQAPVVYWENAAPADAPTILYFHGNGGGLYLHAPALRIFDEKKFHVIAMEYPGYPGVPGDPGETLIVNQAIALDDAISAGQKTKPIIWGYSLGSGVAVQVAAHRPPQALVLEAPVLGIDTRAKELFPYAPIEQLMKNQYRSRDYIRDIHAPLFIMHGTKDLIVPIHHGQDLYAIANQPKTFRSYEGFGHLNLYRSEAYQDAEDFIRDHWGTKDTPPPPPAPIQKPAVKAKPKHITKPVNIQPEAASEPADL